MKNNFPIIVSGPAGSGKTTIVEHVLAGPFKYHFCAPVSTTTRLPRDGEIDGVHYFFVSKREFLDSLDRGDFLEHTEYCGEYYGVRKANLPDDKHTIFIVDVAGADMLKKEYPNAISIMIIPPDFKTQQERLLQRKSETLKSTVDRLERAKYDIEHLDNYDYVIVNDDQYTALANFLKIVSVERMKTINNQEIKNEYFKES